MIPVKATFALGEPLGVRIEGAQGAVTVELWHLDQLVTSVSAEAGTSEVAVDALPEAGYGLRAYDSEGAMATSALDVLRNPFERPRYGFVAEFPSGKDAAALVDVAQRLHLNMVQFYDWAHRYAQLVPEGDEYVDPLGRPLSLTTVRAMTAALAEIGSLSMGYAAVYAVGGVDWDDWKHAGLFKADGEPHRFTDDLLLVVDPSNEQWMKHFTGDLQQSMDEVGFTGFHLDSYGWPKRAFRADGSVCDLNAAFPELLERIRSEVPSSRFLFNNVNDFPTWTTTSAPQDGTYIEVWAPHTTLGHLGGLIDRARAMRPERTPILAAYLSVYGTAPSAVADAAARLVMATIFSHGGTHLLNGEDDTVLIDPYYPKNHQAGASTRDLMRDWYDFLVRYGDLLLSPTAVDVTRSYTGGINEDLVFETPPGVRISTDPEAGTVWVRVVRTRLGLVVHLINLTDQQTVDWDAAKNPITTISGVRLRALKTLSTLPARAADPDRSADLSQVPTSADGLYDVIELPPVGAWSMVVLPEPTTWPG